MLTRELRGYHSIFFSEIFFLFGGEGRGDILRTGFLVFVVLACRE